MSMIEKIIEEYNRYRAPEAEAKIIDKKGNEVKIWIKVPCRTCGLYDYVEDFLYFMEEFGLKGKIVETEEMESGTGNEFIVRIKMED